MMNKAIIPYLLLERINVDPYLKTTDHIQEAGAEDLSNKTQYSTL